MTGRTWAFWVDSYGGKQYKNRRGEFGGVYLVKPSKDFEILVRDCAIIAGVQLCEYARIEIVIYWPDKDDSGPVKGRRTKEVKKGRADGTNTYKSVEDALQRVAPTDSVKERLIKWARQAREEFFYFKSKVMTPKDTIKRARTLRMRENAVKAYIAQCRRALCGAVVRNDRNILEGHWRIMFTEPGTEPKIFVRVREVAREDYFSVAYNRWFGYKPGVFCDKEKR